MLSVDGALKLILDNARPKGPEVVELREAVSRVLAEDVASDVDSPPHNKATVDGFAVVAEDLAEGTAELEVIEDVMAGDVPKLAVTSGKAARVMTGAPIPAGASAMVMVEKTEPLADSSSKLGRVRIQAAKVTPGMNIMRRASSLRKGDTVIERGALLRPIEIGVLAEVGRSRVNVVARPTVAVLTTGNELVPITATPGPGQIRNSNSPMLCALAERCGATAINLGVARDEPAELRRLISEGLKADVLVLSGGVSAGVLDLVPAALAELGVAQVFHKINLKPGKPLWYGVHGSPGSERLVFGLPGNAVSSLVCFELFVRPALGVLRGAGPVGLERIAAELAADFTQRGDRPTYFPAELQRHAGEAKVMPLAWKGSGDLRTLVAANALAFFPAGDRLFRAGEQIEVFVL